MHRHADPTHMTLMSNDKVGWGVGFACVVACAECFQIWVNSYQNLSLCYFCFCFGANRKSWRDKRFGTRCQRKKGFYFRDNAWSQRSAAQGWFLYPFVLVYLISLQGLSNHHSSRNDAASLVPVGLHTRLWKLFVSYQWDKTLLGIFRELCLECCRIRKKNLKFTKFISIFHLHFHPPPFFLNTKVYLIEGSTHPLGRGLQNVSRCTSTEFFYY